MFGWSKPREDLPLVAEAAQHGVRVHAALDQLDRDLLLELPVGALGEIDGAHAAAADALQDLVVADGRADQPVIRSSASNRRASSVAIGVSMKPPDVSVRRQQRLDLAPQRRVARAALVAGTHRAAAGSTSSAA